MLFTQVSFLVFLALTLVGHGLTRPWKTANNLFLLLASWCFFIYWSLADFLIFFGVMGVNFILLAALQAASGAKTRRLLLLLSVGISLSTLALFKYRQFFGHNLVELLGLLGLAWKPASASIAIPLAISFYTFHLISLVSDVYVRKYKAPSFLDYALYLSFFPQILAGPIVRGDQMLPQVEKPPRERTGDVVHGVYLFVLGFFFKAVVADNIADAIDPYWLPAGLARLSAADAWVVALLYSGQIFADFGGYSFMAIGLGKLLGFDLPENFRAPYLAGSFREFWQRWHITLSTFLRDYLYIGALGGNRGPRWRMHLNLFVTMLLGGLWHGPAWNFVAWGALHGCGLVVERLLGFTDKGGKSAALRFLWYGVVQIAVVFAWILFRSPDLHFAKMFFKRLFVLNSHAWNPHLAGQFAPVLLLLVPIVVHHLAHAWPASGLVRQPIWLRGALSGALLYAILVILHTPRGFIYFVF
jgi:alginate O-acetyltransferase complex protein AlgI